MLFGDRIKQLREQLDISQQTLADNTGISKSSISKYESGERTPELETFEAIADYFNVDMDYLKGKTDIRRKYIVTNDGNLLYGNVINDLLMTKNQSLVELLEKISKMSNEEIETLNKLIK